MLKSTTKTLSAAILLSVLFLALSSPAAASPYGPDKKETVFDRLYESDLVIYGKIIQKIKSKNQGDLTEFEVYENMKGGKWSKGSYFYINSIIKHPNKAVGVVFLYRSNKGGVDFYEYNAFYADKKKTMFDYITKVKEYLDAEDNQGRLSWLFSQVDSKNKLIAWDSFAQLGMASYGDLKKAAPSINKESLRYLIVEKGGKANRKSFFCFLLGLAGDPEDAALIKRMIEKPENKDSRILYGAMMSYGLLLRDAPTYFLKQMKTGSKTMKLAVLEAIKNIMLYERPSNPGPILKPLYQAMLHEDAKLSVKAIETAMILKITGPIKYMRKLYFSRFKNNRDGKVAVINYLKFVRKKSPDAIKLLKQIKAKEKDRSLRMMIQGIV